MHTIVILHKNVRFQTGYNFVYNVKFVNSMKKKVIKFYNTEYNNISPLLRSNI